MFVPYPYIFVSLDAPGSACLEEIIAPLNIVMIENRQRAILPRDPSYMLGILSFMFLIFVLCSIRDIDLGNCSMI